MMMTNRSEVIVPRLPTRPTNRHLGKILVLFAWAVGGILVSVLVIYLGRREVVTLFKVTAETERIVFTVVASRTDPIRLLGATVRDDVHTYSNVRGTLQLAESAKVVVTRNSIDPVLYLVVTPPPGSSTVGTLLRDNGISSKLEGGVDASLPLMPPSTSSVQRLNIHFAAHELEIGAIWRAANFEATRPMLRSGRVSLTGLAQGNVPFQAQSFELAPYEMITELPDSISTMSPRPIWWGALMVDAGTPMQGTFAIMDTEILLRRGTEKYRLGVTMFDHVRGHPRLALYFVLFVTALQIAVSIITNQVQKITDKLMSRGDNR